MSSEIIKKWELILKQDLHHPNIHVKIIAEFINESQEPDSLDDLLNQLIKLTEESNDLNTITRLKIFIELSKKILSGKYKSETFFYILFEKIILTLQQNIANNTIDDELGILFSEYLQFLTQMNATFCDTITVYEGDDSYEKETPEQVTDIATQFLTACFNHQQYQLYFKFLLWLINNNNYSAQLMTQTLAEQISQVFLHLSENDIVSCLDIWLSTRLLPLLGAWNSAAELTSSIELLNVFVKIFASMESNSNIHEKEIFAKLTVLYQCFSDIYVGICQAANNLNYTFATSLLSWPNYLTEIDHQEKAQSLLLQLHDIFKKKIYQSSSPASFKICQFIQTAANLMQDGKLGPAIFYNKLYNLNFTARDNKQIERFCEKGCDATSLEALKQLNALLMDPNFKNVLIQLYLNNEPPLPYHQDNKKCDDFVGDFKLVLQQLAQSLKTTLIKEIREESDFMNLLEQFNAPINADLTQFPLKSSHLKEEDYQTAQNLMYNILLINQEIFFSFEKNHNEERTSLPASISIDRSSNEAQLILAELHQLKRQLAESSKQPAKKPDTGVRFLSVPRSGKLF